jgi:hypothetical protein
VNAPNQPTHLETTRQIRAGAVAIHRTFAPIYHLLAEVERLALNASVACGRLGGQGRSFATVARDLHATSTELGQRIHEVERVFSGLACDVAAWSESERRLLLLRRGLASVHATPNVKSKAAIMAAERKVSAELDQHIQALGARITSLDGHVDRIRWTAVRQTRYLCILASIEKAHLGERGEAVEAVVSAMGVLADRLGTVEEEARDRVLDLHLHVRRMQRSHKKQPAFMDQAA